MLFYPPVLITDLTILFNVMIFLMPLQPQQGFQVYRSGYIRKNRHLFKGLGLYGCTFMVSSLPKGICILKHWSEHRSSSRGQKLLNYKSIHFFAYFSFIYKIVSCFSLGATKQRIVIRSGEVFSSPCLLYDKIRQKKSSTQRYKSKVIVLIGLQKQQKLQGISKKVS